MAQQLSILYCQQLKTADPANPGDFVKDKAGNYITMHGATNADIPADAPPGSMWVVVQGSVDGRPGISHVNERIHKLGTPKFEMCKSGAGAIAWFPIEPK
jgi:hypothetical protein